MDSQFLGGASVLVWIRRRELYLFSHDGSHYKILKYYQVTSENLLQHLNLGI